GQACGAGRSAGRSALVLADLHCPFKTREEDYTRRGLHDGESLASQHGVGNTRYFISHWRIVDSPMP
ncbi:hypothetical protein FOZ62_028639, partial [Perkinsus olseni]